MRAKPIRVAINGFGRIGRAVFRIIAERPKTGIEVVAINDLADDDVLAYLLMYDSVMGPFEHKVEVADGVMTVDRHKVKMLYERDPTKLPWKDLDIDVVIESTGVFRTREALQRHIQAGAKRVILTVPADDEIDQTVVLGVNDSELDDSDVIVSNASCTTNCLAPLAKVLDEAFGIRRGLMTTVHAYTNDQRLADVPHKDLRRSRAATENIIPTTTGAAKAVGKVYPKLDGKLHGMAMRVPVPDGSTVDLVVELDRQVSVEEVNAAVKAAADGPLAGVIQYTEDPIVSTDVIGNPHSSVFDAGGTQILGGNLIKVLSWYDNEWGYSQRVVDLIERLAKLKDPVPA
ncbi:MAG: type I glyceraldehyde-3-phosphate dehydrogenase [Acidimicrobiia bacterium]